MSRSIREIELARTGKKTRIVLKLNNLADEALIVKLYEASQAGVLVDICVRGVCSLVPGLPGISDRIRVISIVDRFLEHSRVMIFHGGGDLRVFISSSDWMARNMDNRVEVSVPIYDECLKKIICDLMELQFSDTVKARIVDEHQSNEYVKLGKHRKVRSQVSAYNYIKQVEST